MMRSGSTSDMTDLQYPAVGDLPPPGFVDYYLHWQINDVRAESDSWVTQSNLGYTVTIESGWLSNYRVTLAPCTTMTFFNWLGFVINTAHANDGGAIDLSESTEGVAESLTQFKNQEWARRPLQGHRYCKLHHLMARADETIRMRPTEIELNRITLLIKGKAEKNNIVTRFDLSSTFAHGSLHDLNERLVIYGSKTDLNGTERIQVVLERNPSRWFDDIDFDALTDRQLGYMIGDQIIATTTYHVKAED